MTFTLKQVVIDSSSLVSLRTTVQANSHRAYVNVHIVHMHMYIFISKSALGSRNHLETSSVLLGKMNRFVESDQMQRKVR